MLNFHHVPAYHAFAKLPVLVKIVVAEPELRGVIFIPGSVITEGESTGVDEYLIPEGGVSGPGNSKISIFRADDTMNMFLGEVVINGQKVIAASQKSLIVGELTRNSAGLVPDSIEEISPDGLIQIQLG